MEKNTPTPWTKLLSYPIDGMWKCVIESRPNDLMPVFAFGMTQEEAEANAELIVKAVNAFSETRQLLKDIRRHGLIEKDGYESLVRRLGELITD